MTESFEAFRLDKSLWTEIDFDKMSWHDCFIYALSLGEKNKLLFDIDYIFQWVDPGGERNNFRFWISPCTIVFENVYDLKFDLEISEPFELTIDNILYDNPQRPNNADYIKREFEYDWTIDTLQGEIKFKSVGYKQYVRRTPILIEQQRIGIEKRNGISFECKAIEENG